MDLKHIGYLMPITIVNLASLIIMILAILVGTKNIIIYQLSGSNAMRDLPYSLDMYVKSPLVPVLLAIQLITVPQSS